MRMGLDLLGLAVASIFTEPMVANLLMFRKSGALSGSSGTGVGAVKATMIMTASLTFSSFARKLGLITTMGQILGVPFAGCGTYLPPPSRSRMRSRWRVDLLRVGCLSRQQKIESAAFPNDFAASVLMLRRRDGKFTKLRVAKWRALNRRRRADGFNNKRE